MMIAPWLFVLIASAARPGHDPVQRDIVSVSIDETVVHRGNTSRVTIWVDVRDGYHIQASEVEDESLIPTSLVVDSTENLTVSSRKFPQQKRFRLEGTDTFLAVYDGRFPVTLSIRAAAAAPPGKTALNARLRYQACDARTCFFPRQIDFPIPLEVRE